MQLLQYSGTVALRQPCVHSVLLDGFGGGGAPAGVPAGAPSGECLRDGCDGEGGNRCGSTLDAKSTGNQWRMQFVRRNCELVARRVGSFTSASHSNLPCQDSLTFLCDFTTLSRLTRTSKSSTRPTTERRATTEDGLLVSMPSHGSRLRTRGAQGKRAVERAANDGSGAGRAGGGGGRGGGKQRRTGVVIGQCVHQARRL